MSHFSWPALVSLALLCPFTALADPPGAAEAATPENLERLNQAPVIALVRLQDRVVADCSGIGWYHAVLKVVAARQGKRIRTAHHAYPLIYPGPEQGSWFVAGLQPTRWAPKKHLCLPSTMVADSQVTTLVAVKDEAEGRALLTRLRPKARP